MRTPLAALSVAALLTASAGQIPDSTGNHYSPLTEITPQNVLRLSRAWTYHTGDKGRQFETTPLLAGNLLFITTQTSRVIALEPETGHESWSFDPHAVRGVENRGVAYWPGDRERPSRLLLTTGDGLLFAIDAKSGKPVMEFGDNGVVNLRTGMTERFPKATYKFSSPPAIYRDLAIVAPSTQENVSQGPSGDPRAFDVRTGKLVWRFHTVPRPGEPNNESWGPDGWKDRAGPSLWGEITVDQTNGLLFLPIGNPTDSFYGADRKGKNLYANSVVALNAATGKLRWYYQLVHHDIFDYDVTGAPALVDALKDGRRIPAIAEITKMGLLFILDRMTGQPVFGVEERPVPSSGVPGEQTSPTQPFPIRPLPLARTTMTREEISKRTPAAERYCLEQYDRYQHGDLYTPFGLKPTLVFPGSMGGGNWGGVSFDPKLGYIFVNTSNMGGIGHMAPTPPGSPVPYRNESAYARFLDQDQYPCQQPPWGELSAVNTNTGDIAWRVPLGGFEELQSEPYKHGGTPNVGASLATAGGLVFIGATNDSRFRAFDSRTGKELWSTKLEAIANSTPIAFQGRDGHQYVVIAAGGPAHLRNVGNSLNGADSLIAFSLNGRETETIPVTQSTRPAQPASGNASEPAVSGDLPEAAGKETVIRVCSKCHGIETFSRMRMNPAGWQVIVTDMQQRGAAGTETEMQAVTDYLGKYLARK
jgi:quinoprotein glucose dehydrogenase